MAETNTVKDLESNALDSREELSNLRNVEYEQASEDWRHRDEMTWQSLAVSITITGIIFGFVQDADVGPLIIVVWLLVSLFNFTILLRIIKDHYYQMGGIEMMLYKLGGIELIKSMQDDVTDEFRDDYNLRRQKPSDAFFNASIKAGRVPYPFLYQNVFLKISAYKLYIFIQICLVLLTFGAFGLELYEWLISLKK